MQMLTNITFHTWYKYKLLLLSNCRALSAILAGNAQFENGDLPFSSARFARISCAVRVLPEFTL